MIKINFKMLKSASAYYKENNISTSIINKKIYINLNDLVMELSDIEIRFRSRIYDKEQEYLQFIKDYNNNNN